jgi:hypothetical protein
MNTDKLTTLSGGLVGVCLLLEAFNILSIDQSNAFRTAMPMIVMAIGVALQGYWTNK